MAISYNVYTNNGQGGQVDYSRPIATTTTLSYVAGPLAFSSDHTFAVRAFDVASGIEEANTDARVRIILDPSGNDATARPNAVVGLRARGTAGGTCWVTWGYSTTGQGASPSGFNVNLTAASLPSPVNPAATVAFLPNVYGYACSLSNVPEGVPCSIAVQAVGGSGGPSGPVATFSFTYVATPLSGVDSLVAAPIA